MKSAPFLARYLFWLVLALGISFGLHTWFRIQSGLDPTGDLLARSYGVNFVLAFAIVAVLFAFRRKLKNQIGFLFIAGSLLKFLVFFIFFHPSFTADEVMTRGEFASFFAPYFISLILETYFASRMLRNLEREHPA